LSKQLLQYLKEARERLKQTPETSSRPPSSRAPWQASEVCEPKAEAPEQAPDVSQAPDSVPPALTDSETQPRFQPVQEESRAARG